MFNNDTEVTSANPHDNEIFSNFGCGTSGRYSSADASDDVVSQFRAYLLSLDPGELDIAYEIVKYSNGRTITLEEITKNVAMPENMKAALLKRIVPILVQIHQYLSASESAAQDQGAGYGGGGGGGFGGSFETGGGGTVLPPSSGGGGGGQVGGATHPPIPGGFPGSGGHPQTTPRPPVVKPGAPTYVGGQSRGGTSSTTVSR